MHDVALVTSTYRAEKFLPGYVQRIRTLASDVHDAGLSMQVLIVANDAQIEERRLIESLVLQVHNAKTAEIVPLYVARETLYASWNRGMQAADARMFGPNNVDDTRTLEGILEAHRLVCEGNDLVDFPMIVRQVSKRFGLLPQQKDTQVPIPFQTQKFGRKDGVGPFFFTTPELYRKVGPFDSNFRLSGDLEWGGRAMDYAKFTPTEVCGGIFYAHGGNLSSTGNPLEDVERNIIFMRRGDWDELRPVDPELMQKCWDDWGHRGGTLPDTIAQWLWGAGSHERWRRYIHERSQHPFIRRIRLALARRGLLSSAEWDATHLQF